MTTRPTGGIRVVFSSARRKCLPKTRLWMVDENRPEWVGKGKEVADLSCERESKQPAHAAWPLPCPAQPRIPWLRHFFWLTACRFFIVIVVVSRRRPWWNRLCVGVSVCPLSPSLSPAAEKLFKVFLASWLGFLERVGAGWDGKTHWMRVFH